MNQKDMDFLEANGWTVECESPLEIRDNETGSFATGYAAKCVLESLLNEENENTKEITLNQKISDAIEKAFDTAEYPASQQYRIEPNKYFCDKFAELIIKQCADIPTLMWLDNEVNADVAVKIRNKILNNFEIEDDTEC